ncbi:hypothetical protein ACIPSJ_27475 [Streptomyces sp. NPDC090088]|uniref:hypothetical protein n=1 Tax=Streptomyces sp. NPDC090088 TaxID=3365944 RepID=UPI0037F1A2A8
MPDESRGEFAPDHDRHDEDTPEQAEFSTRNLLSLETSLTLAAGIRENTVARISRLEADQRLVEILRRDGFQGPRYDKAAAGWWSYSWRILVKWTRTGEIFARARQAGRPVPPGMITTTWTQDDRYQVATESVMAGMEMFRERGLVQGQWNPQGGASLTTYAVGASIRSFRPAYMAWFRSDRTGQAELDTGPRGAGDEPQRDIPDQRATDPYYAAATNDELARILPHITDRQVREGLGWRALGYTQAEAAVRSGLTEKALERRLSRARTRIMIAYVHEPELGEGGAR